jgi:elongation factor Ts
MMDCKNALVEADGDLEKAVEALRLKGVKDAGKRAQRTAANGLVTARLDGTSAFLQSIIPAPVWSRSLFTSAAV